MAKKKSAPCPKCNMYLCTCNDICSECRQPKNLCVCTSKYIGTAKARAETTDRFFAKARADYFKKLNCSLRVEPGSVWLTFQDGFHFETYEEVGKFIRYVEAKKSVPSHKCTNAIPDGLVLRFEGYFEFKNLDDTVEFIKHIRKFGEVERGRIKKP